MSVSLPNKSFIAIWTTGILLAFFSVFLIGLYENERRQEHVDHHFDNKLKSLNHATTKLKDVMTATRAFLTQGNSPNAKQFEQFLKNRTGIDSGIDSILWAPAISSDGIESLSRRAEEMGLFSYQVNPVLGAGAPQDQTGKTFPVLYVSPLFEGSDYLGYRLDADLGNQYAIDKSINTGGFSVSHFTHNSLPGLRLFLPVFNSNNQIAGFVVANLIVHEFLGQAWKQEVNSLHFDLTVFNEDQQQVLFTSHVNQTLSTNHFFEQKATKKNMVMTDVLGQKWHVSLTVISHSSGFFIYGALVFLLILMLTFSVATAVRFYAIRLRVSDRVIEEKTQTLAIQAVKDSLTGLFNRQALSNEIESKLVHIRNGRSKGFSILFVDLDRFKMINDSMGHLLGDELLQQVAQRLIKNSRDSDFCFRFGGDEFVVLLNDQICQYQLARISERYANLLSAPYLVQGQSCHIGASVGISIVTDPHQDIATILREADTAMYHAKSSAQDKIAFFHERMFKDAKQRFQLEQDLTVAIELRQIYLVYQPIYCALSDSITGFETLLRWNHPQRGHISPADFIPIAEETGLIIKLGDWVLKETCRTLQRLWHCKELDVIPRFNVNVSAKQFESQHVIHTIHQLLDSCDFPADKLGIEMTESLLLDESVSCSENLRELEKLGISIYLDDFGTGYSSLAVLNDYPVDVVKMDRGFVSKIGEGNARSDNLCEAIINMAHTIDMQVVAEGVETKKQLDLLNHFHCDFIQGFYKSKPVTACKILDTLNKVEDAQKQKIA